MIHLTQKKSQNFSLLEVTRSQTHPKTPLVIFKSGKLKKRKNNGLSASRKKNRWTHFLLGLGGRDITEAVPLRSTWAGRFDNFSGRAPFSNMREITMFFEKSFQQQYSVLCVVFLRVFIPFVFLGSLCRPLQSHTQVVKFAL